MSFRRRLLLLFSLTVVVSVAAVVWIVSAMARRAFDRASDQEAAALMGQFRREFNRRGDEINRRLQAIAATSEAARIAATAAQGSPNYSAFLADAQVAAEAQRLDFLEFADDRGTIISSAHWPAKFGYREPLAKADVRTTPFLHQEETPSGPALGLFAVRMLSAGERKVYVIGGIRMDRSFLSSLELPQGMRLMLYENLDPKVAFSADHLLTPAEPILDPQALVPLILQAQRDARDCRATIHWRSGDDETVNAFPLMGESNQVLGVLLVSNPRQIYSSFRAQLRSAALVAGAAGLLLAALLSSLAAARVTRPVEQLAHAAREVAAGNWDAVAPVTSSDEIGELAESFNRMTRELHDQGERLVQAERVAAWRELARRLAHELKNPLFPLQLTVENLLRSRERGPQEFEETFRESAQTLLSEIANLRSIVSRFSEFSKMPAPHFQSVRLNELLENVVRTHHAQLSQGGIELRIEVASAEPIAADPELLHRALSNLVLNAIEAMPQGGILTVRSSQHPAFARIEIADTGMGLNAEESARLFTPYYTTKRHGTGLGLAIAQAVVADHGGRISAFSEPGRGTTFMIELPENRDKLGAAQSTHV